MRGEGKQYKREVEKERKKKEKTLKPIEREEGEEKKKPQIPGSAEEKDCTVLMKISMCSS